MPRIIALILILAGSAVFIALRLIPKNTSSTLEQAPITVEELPNISTEELAPEGVITPNQPEIPAQKTLSNNYHVIQTFNNCGPAALSMALSYYSVNISQQELGAQLRPYQNPVGDNDDKSTTLEEMAKKAEELGFTAYHRPNGSFEVLSALVANDMPVITRTWLKPDDDIGHYRVVKGYDTVAQTLLQDDSLQGANLTYSMEEFNSMWDKFGYEYLVLIPTEKQQIAKQILGEDVDAKKAWAKSLNYWQSIVAENPLDTKAIFSLSIAYYMNGMYEESIKEFEKVENALPSRALWYQIEPILAYKQLGRNDRVFEITDRILNNHNRAFSELYILRGEIYKEQGNIDLARAEFEKAVFYNSQLQSAKDALESL